MGTNQAFLTYRDRLDLVSLLSASSVEFFALFWLVCSIFVFLSVTVEGLGAYGTLIVNAADRNTLSNEP
jgi:hypothetical protein